MNGNGFARDDDSSADNAAKFVISLERGGNLTFRSEEDQRNAVYFCRAKANEFNHSNNPTVHSGSNYEYVKSEFEGDPQVYITTVGLYNSQDELVAVGRLSSPVQKNYASETTIKVKLTY